MARERLIIGVMSGTSVDAIDAALVRVRTPGGGRYGAEVVAHAEHLWPRRLRERLLAVMAPAESRTGEICELNFLVAREFAEAVEDVLAESGVKREKITAIASHGQTVCHLPVRQAKGKSLGMGDKKIGSTLQLGDVSVIAALTGIVTVGNFRPADIAAGGQGAPLVPWADDALLSDPRVTRCVQNIGGIANVTYLPPLTERKPSTWTFYTPVSVSTETFMVRPDLIAFDTGPGNMLIDAVVSLGTGGRMRFDRGGKLASKGNPDARLFRELRRHGYFERLPPKSTGREEFGEKFARKLIRTSKRGKVKLEDLVHTVTRLTAWSIVDAYLHFLPRLPEEVILCGGGAENPVLVRMLGEELGQLKNDFARSAAPRLRRIDEFGIPNKAKEAASFALLGAATLDGVSSNVPSVTGAVRPMVLGVVARPLAGGGGARMMGRRAATSQFRKMRGFK